MMSATFWVGLSLGIAVLLVIMMWSVRRHQSPILNVECDAPIDKLMPSLSGLTLGAAIAGNSVELLQNGAFFDVLIERIRAARKTVRFETFLWEEGVLGQGVADALSDRAKAGLKVRVTLDATGSRKVGKAAREQMKDAGCRLVFFHKRSL